MWYKRDVVEAPQAAISNGKFIWGTYNNTIKQPNLLDANSPYGLFSFPFFKRLRLKEWQAFQTGLKDWFIFGALYNAKLSAIVVFSVFHKPSKQIYHFQKMISQGSLAIAKGLENSKSMYSSKLMSLIVENKLNQGQIIISAFAKQKDKPQIELNLQAKHIGEPIVVVQPFAKNKGMYSHKNIMPCNGFLKIENQVIEFNQTNAFTIFDDHKGYYPYKMKYDWVTGGGFSQKGELTGFNFTKNQVVQPDLFNENCLWHGEKMHPLPPVVFKRNDEFWSIKDEYGQVDLRFYPQISKEIKFNYLIVGSDYLAPYGYFKGKIKTEVVTIDCENIGMYGMGEKKRNKM